MRDEDLRMMFRSTEEGSVSREMFYKAQLLASERRGRRNATLSAVGGAVLSLTLFVGGFAVVNNNDNRVSTVENLALAEYSKLESKTLSLGSLASSGRPERLVGASSAGRLVVINGSTGKTERLLTQVKDPNDQTKGGLLGHVTLTPEGDTVYFDVRTADKCSGQIKKISTAGGQVGNVIDGYAPTLDSVGSKLAYVRQTTCNELSIVVRSLVQQEDVVIVTRKLDVAQRVASLSWSPDGRQLIGDFRSDDPSKNRLVYLDVTRVNTFDSSPTLQPGQQSRNGTTYEWPTFLPDGNIFLSQRCCDLNPDSPRQEESRLVVLDSQGKEQGVVAYGFLDVPHTATASDVSGSHLLYMSGTDLMVSDDRARPGILARGLLGAAWR